jgi:hypothetical protein
MDEDLDINELEGTPEGDKVFTLGVTVIELIEGDA